MGFHSVGDTGGVNTPAQIENVATYMEKDFAGSDVTKDRSALFGTATFPCRDLFRGTCRVAGGQVAFDVIPQREVKFRRYFEGADAAQESPPLLCHFTPILHSLPPRCYLHSRTQVPDNHGRELDRRVSLQPRRPAAHSPARSSPASHLGEGGTSDGGRRLFLFRSRANQESARPLRPAGSPRRHPAIARSHAETGCRHGESTARGWGLSERTPHRFPAPRAAA